MTPGGRSGTGFLLDPDSSPEGAFPDLTVLDCRNSPLLISAGETCAVPAKDLFSFRHSGSRMVRLVVVMEIDGEIRPVYSIYKRNKDKIDMQCYFIVDVDAAAAAREKAFKQAVKEAGLASKYGDAISTFIHDGFDSSKTIGE